MDDDLLWMMLSKSYRGVIKSHTSSRITKNVASDVQVFPNDQGFNSTKLECLESVGNTKAVFA